MTINQTVLLIYIKSGSKRRWAQISGEQLKLTQHEEVSKENEPLVPRLLSKLREMFCMKSFRNEPITVFYSIQNNAETVC